MRLHRGWHLRWWLLTFAIAALFLIAATTSFEDDGSVAVIPVTGLAFLGVLFLLASRLDLRHQSATWFEAFLRLCGPTALALIYGSWLMNKGIFAHWPPLAAGTTAVVSAILVGLLVHLLIPAEAPAATDPSSPASERQRAPLGDADTAPQGNVHRITGGILALIWVPLGGLTVLLLNWCPNEGTASFWWPASFVFVATQVIGNPAVGYWFDRRFGNRGGTMLAVGRSLLFAVVWAVGLLVLFGLLAPNGESRYCG